MKFETIKYAVSMLAISYVCFRLGLALGEKDDAVGLNRIERFLASVFFCIGIPGGLLLGWIDRLIGSDK